MAVKIRLTRVGATKRPSYRVVATDSRTARDGRPLEIIGFYDPLTEPATVRLDGGKLERWIGQGAKPTEVVERLMRQAGLGPTGAAAAPAEPAPDATETKPRRAPRKRTAS